VEKVGKHPIWWKAKKVAKKMMRVAEEERHRKENSKKVQRKWKRKYATRRGKL